jgi:mono/diheme cytochrome c family protein
MTCTRLVFNLVPLAYCVACCAGAEPVSFQKQIRPILAKNCSGCHQPAGRQSDLSVTSFADFQKGGRKGPAFVPGKPDDSVVIAYLTGKTTPQMPFGGKPLPAEQIEVVRQWIKEGAVNDSVNDTTEMITPGKPTVYHAPPVVTALAWSGDGKLLAVSGYREILLHDASGLVARLPGLSGRIHSLAFSPDGSTLVAVGGDPARFGEVQIWDLASRKQRRSVMLTNDTLFGLSFSPDGARIAFGGTDKSIHVMDVSTGKELRKIDHHEDWVFGTVFGIDGKRLVSVSRDRAAKLTDANTGAFIENVNLLKEPLTAVARHPKKDWVLIGGAERIPYLYRMDRQRAMRIADDSTLIRKFAQQDGPITTVAFSPDAQWIAVGSEIGPVRVYNAETGALAAECAGAEGGTYAVVFRPDGKAITTAGFDGTVRIFDLSGKLERSFVPVEVTE